jgi:acyl carrier protein
MPESATASIDERIVRLVAKMTGLQMKKLTMESRLLQDLGVDGDDADELINAYAEEFGVDMASFRFSTHFRSEPSLLRLLSFLPSQKHERITTKVPITLRDLAEGATFRCWKL